MFYCNNMHTCLFHVINRYSLSYIPFARSMVSKVMVACFDTEFWADTYSEKKCSYWRICWVPNTISLLSHTHNLWDAWAQSFEDAIDVRLGGYKSDKKYFEFSSVGRCSLAFGFSLFYLHIVAFRSLFKGCCAQLVLVHQRAGIPFGLFYLELSIF